MPRLSKNPARATYRKARREQLKLARSGKLADQPTKQVFSSPTPKETVLCCKGCNTWSSRDYFPENFHGYCRSCEEQGVQLKMFGDWI